MNQNRSNQIYLIHYYDQRHNREAYSEMISPEILEKSIQAVAKQQNIRQTLTSR